MLDLTAGQRATADALHTAQVFRSLPPESVVTTARGVLDVLPSLRDDDVVDFLGMGGTESVRVMVEYDAAIAHFLQGDLDQATQRLRRALHLPGAQYPIWRFYTVGSLALVRAWTGHCTEALQLADAALSGARAIDVIHHPAVIHAHLAGALAHLYRFDLDRAAESLDMADLQNQRRPSNVVNLDLHRALAAQLCAAAGDSTEALGRLAPIGRLGGRTTRPGPRQPRPPRAAAHRRRRAPRGTRPAGRPRPGRRAGRGPGRPGPGRR